MKPAYYFRELWRYVKSAKSAVFSSTIVIALAVLLLGIYITISINSVKLLKLIRDKVEIDAYLGDNFQEADASKLINSIKTIGGVKAVKYSSIERTVKMSGEVFAEAI